MAQFRAKARAVDLLGKGQIADLPTAISELWKNGYDAYGDNLEATIYLKGYQDIEEPIFILTDDGKGMSRSEILDKWFVLGTDSKSRNDQMEIKGPDTLFKDPRVKMGEKGIGRLAVAYLGPQMLMLTKKANFPVEAVFFDWRILENYDLFLSDVNIPLKNIDSLEEFHSAFNELKKELLLNFPEVRSQGENPWEAQKLLRQQIIDECNSLVIPECVVEENIRDFFLSAQYHSTRFFVFQPDEQILELRHLTKNDARQDIREDSHGRYTMTSLAGLFNNFDHRSNKTQAKIWIKQNNEGRFDILDFVEFFKPDDFKLGDHEIDGYFDEFGKFSGRVRIYKKEINHEFIPLTKQKVKKTNYGPLRIKLGYLSGKLEESQLNPLQYTILENKLDYFGGLYIYRDGFRVLPYGRVDNDFLEFEERRGRSAGDHFFAKRRMFGYLAISKISNPKLVDKSSREGFVTNSASRELKSDLIAFFRDLARKYFATHAQFDYKDIQQKELKRLAHSEREENEKDKQARKDFAKRLAELPIELKRFEADYVHLINQLKILLNNSDLIYNDVQNILFKIENLRLKISDFNLQKPVRFIPTELQEKKYYSYSSQFQGVQEVIKESSIFIQSVRDQLLIHEQYKEYLSQKELYSNRIISRFQEFKDQLTKSVSKLNSEFDLERVKFSNEFLDKCNQIHPDQADPLDISESSKLLSSIFFDIQERFNERVNPFLDHLNRLSFDVNEDNLVGFYKNRFLEMKKEWEQTYELAQLGIAVEIIDHQFNTLYSQLSESIKSLRSHISDSNDSRRSYENLYLAFDHLLDNYKLLKPLYRTTGRIRKELTGKELKQYAEEFFKTRLIEQNVNFEITPAAEKWSVFSFESVFKPVLLNVLNNALYWIMSSSDRVIRIDAKDGKLLIMNSGEPIEDFRLNDIFKLFYSGRPNGRGIGLYLAKQSLNGIGFEIEATNDKNFNLFDGACFVIKTLDSK